MGTTLLIATTVAYCGVALSFYSKGHYPMAICFAGYAFANIGFILESMK